MLVGVLGSTSLAVFPHARAELIFKYDFDSGLTSGTLSGKATIGADDTGVTGVSGDAALDNTASTMSGSGGGTYYNYSDGALGTLTSFTVTLWFKTDGQQAKGATRLFDNGSQLLAFDGADTGASQKLTFNSGSNSGVIQLSNSVLATAGDWVFVALTYNADTKSVSLYAGTEKSASLVSVTGSSSLGAINWGSDPTAKLMFGANTSNGRSLDGWLDNIKFYGSASDGSGALDSEMITSIWKADMTAIPEPATWVLLSGFCILGAAFLLRRMA